MVRTKNATNSSRPRAKNRKNLVSASSSKSTVSYDASEESQESLSNFTLDLPEPLPSPPFDVQATVNALNSKQSGIIL